MYLAKTYFLGKQSQAVGSMVGTQVFLSLILHWQEKKKK